MSGPIVRTGTTPKFWQNYDAIFGSKKADAPKKSAAKAEAKSAKKAAKKSAKRKKSK